MRELGFQEEDKEKNSRYLLLVGMAAFKRLMLDAVLFPFLFYHYHFSW